MAENPLMDELQFSHSQDAANAGRDSKHGAAAGLPVICAFSGLTQKRV
ncbi:MAG TPA: hypothetical protein VF194_08245 [Ferrovibrio sp.]|jgi:hypothetical protein